MNSPDTRPVVAGIDGCPGSGGALRYAAAEATRRRTSLCLVHVIPFQVPVWPGIPLAGGFTSELHSVGQSLLDDAAASVHDLAPDLEVSATLTLGPTGAALVEAAGDAQLVVVGHETRHGLDRLLVGAVTATVASRARCEVAVVPADWSADHPRGRVVAALKSSSNAHELLSEAFAQASARHATLTVVTAWELPDAYLDRIEFRTHASEWEEEGRRVLNELLADWLTAYPDVPVELRIEHGRAASVLLSVSRDSDLLLVSRRHHSLPPYGRIGWVAHAVILASDVPVEVVPFVGTAPAASDELVLERSGEPVK